MRALALALVTACGFPAPSLHTPDGGSDAAVPDAPPSCPGCVLLAIEPPIANTGDTIVLEGAFQAPATVQFPGGASAAATVLGPSRATVVVPSGASAGELTIFGGTGHATFQRASFRLGLQSFEAFDDQTNGARPMPSLVVGRASQDQMVAVAQGCIYMVGGVDSSDTALASIERARVNADGSLGAFEILPATLTTPRSNGAVIVLGDFLYVIGGDSTAAGNTIERATIAADGSLGTFSLVSTTLTAPRGRFTARVIGNFLYVIGGITGDQLSVERAPIDVDGSLGAFATTTTTLALPRANAYSIVSGDHLYVIGGDPNLSASAARSVESAPIQPDGSLGAFAVAGSLGEDHLSSPVFVVGGTLYVLGSPSIEAAPIHPDGTLDAFVAVSGIAETIAQGGGSCIAGGYAYVLGGSDPTAARTARVQRASLNASGELGSFLAANNVALATPRSGHTAALVGTTVYVMGGGGASGPVGSIEQATTAADGTLQAFAASSVSLPVTLQGATSATIGRSIYVIGGNSQGSFRTAVSRTILSSDGTLQAFASAPSLGTARANSTAAIVGDVLYVFGGRIASGAIASVERATVNSDGSLGTFGFAPGVDLATGRFDHCVVIAGTSLYAIGGSDSSSSLATVERATINLDSTISSFAIVNGTKLATARSGHTCKVVGGFLYVIGGDGVNTIERAPIAADGSLGAFVTVTGVSLDVSRSEYSAITIGDFAYAIGGANGSGFVGNAAQASLQ